jgi:HK97 family phage prohead protease
MIYKTIIANAKAVDEAQGIVEAYTNTMGIPDSDGDVLESSAFDNSIRDNLPIPVLFGHDQSQLVGKVLFAQPQHVAEDEFRLFTRMQMNMDTEAGRDAFSNVAGHFIREWSVGFNISKDSDVEYNKGDVRRIKNLDWVEVSTVIRGASPSTSTVAAKTSESRTLELEDDALDASHKPASDTGESAFDTGVRVIRLARAKLQLIGIKNNKET